MLVHIAIADAYGAGFEFSDPLKIQDFNDLSSYQTHDLYGFSGKYTDDTQMSLAIAELMINQPVWGDVAIASQFVECFKRDPRQGYASGFYGLLQEVSGGEELLQRIRARNGLTSGSTRNGAAMRSVPLGYLKMLKI